jgi:hypothetical protein
VTVPTIKIYINGHVDDLYALSILFPEHNSPHLHVVTGITGTKYGMLDRVENADQTETYVTGDGCLPLIQANGIEESGWIAQEIIAPLNGYAALADSSFKPTIPVSACWVHNGATSSVIFASSIIPNRPTRLITTNWHPLLAELLQSRVEYMTRNPLGAYAAAIISGIPSWAEYYRLLEDIAGHIGTTLEKLDETKLVDQKALKAFKKAANQRAFGRHGGLKRNASIPQESLMNLLEAREFVRNVVSAWLDKECGGHLPRDRVNGGPLRFGLDD